MCNFELHQSGCVQYSICFFTKVSSFSNTDLWNPAKMFFQETLDINCYYYHSYCTIIHCWQEKVSHNLEKKLIKFSQKRGKITYLYKSAHTDFSLHFFLTVFLNAYNASSHPEMFLGKGVLKICSKFTGEHPCRSAISKKMQSNFIEIALRHGCSPVNLLHIFRTRFSRNTSGRLLLMQARWWLYIHLEKDSVPSFSVSMSRFLLIWIL